MNIIKKTSALIFALAAMGAVSCSSAAPTSEKADSSASADIQMTDKEEQDGSSPERSSEEITLKMAVFLNGRDKLDGQIMEAIDDFNQEDNGYRIEFIDYSQYYDQSYNESSEPDLPGGGYSITEEGTAAVKMQLTTDIMKGGVFDIIPDYTIPDRGGLFENLANKGAFTDLNKFMSSDEEINMDTLNSHVLELCETDGKLNYMPLKFQVNTLVGKREYVGDKENWTLDEFKEHWAAMPEGTKIQGHNTRDYVYMTIIRGDITRFIDYKNGTCSFDSPEFIDILEFLDTFPYSLDYDYNEYDHNAVNFLNTAFITGFGSYHGTMHDITDTDFTKTENILVGYPTEDGSGSFFSTSERFGICSASSEEKQYGAWLFLRELCGYEYQYADDHYYDYYNEETGELEDHSEFGFPVNNRAFEKIKEEASEHEGEKNIQQAQGTEFDAGYPTKAECEKITEYINSTSRLDSNLDDDLWNIINEELAPFFAGERNADDTAEMMQDRVSIMVSEKS